MPAKMELDNAAAEVIRKALGLEGMFKDMKAAGIQGLFPKSSLLQCAPYDHIIEQGESSRDVYIVCEGTVSIAQTMGSAGANLADLGKGEVFGEMALLRDGVRVASAVALHREQKILKRILATPLKVRTFFAAEIVAHLILSVVKSLIIIAAGVQ
ncbi:MAG: cyclic nucleotide-binding domain-containing protein, partial [Elusimicrobiota bacterium]